MFLGNGIFIRGIVIFWVMVFILEGWYLYQGYSNVLGYWYSYPRYGIVFRQ